MQSIARKKTSQSSIISSCVVFDWGRVKSITKAVYIMIMNIAMPSINSVVWRVSQIGLFVISNPPLIDD